MLIDCDSCAMRDLACGDCVVTVLLGGPAQRPAGAEPSAVPGEAAGVTRIELDGPERAAIAVLAGQGLVPPLRLVPKDESGARRGPDRFESGMLPGAETA
jgi:hypothetical protein